MDNGFSTQVKALRKRLNLTQKQLAGELGVHEMTVSRWELGVVTPSHMAMRQIERISNLGKKGVK